MRIVMIHAIAESIPPVGMAFGDVFPEAEVINLLDESLFIDFDDQLTPKLRRRMSQLICYSAEHGADAIGLACSVYASVVDSARELVDVPVVSSYGPVVNDALQYGRRIGVVASVPATLRDSEYYLRRAAIEQGVDLDPHMGLAEDLIPVLRKEGVEGLRRRLMEEVEALAPHVDVVMLGQFSFAVAYSEVAKQASVPVLSAPHSSARQLKQLLQQLQ